MDFKFVGFCLGLMVAALSAFMMIPAFIDFADGHIVNGWAFVRCGICGFFAGSLLSITNSHHDKTLGLRESFIMTTLCWLAAAVVAALPLHFSDVRLGFIDAFFEAVSGFTTTGATVLTNLDGASRGILVWRSLTQWIGGMGVIGLAIVFLPFMRVGGMQLFRMESSDKSDKLMPRTGSIVTSLLLLYSGLTLACMIAYRWQGMSGFDALNHALTTLPTGGFSTHDASIGFYKSAALEWTAMLFMIVAALPMILFLKLFLRLDRDIFMNEQVRTFLVLILLSGLLLGWWHYETSSDNAADSLRHAFFSVTSLVSTTGYRTVDYTSWGPLAIVLALFLTYLGGCSGSTAGGLKIMRLIILARQGMMQVKRLLYPSGVFSLLYQGQPVQRPVLQSVMVFAALYVVCNVVLALLLAATGLDFLTALSGAATAIANVGPGVGNSIGPSSTMQSLPDAAKVLMCFGMILGRLELMTILVLFHPAFWRS